MGRKSMSASTDAAAVMDRMRFSETMPPTPSESREGSAVSLEMVNVFGEPAAEGAGAAAGDPRMGHLRLTAWVANVSYVKDVWVDAYLMDASGGVAHAETMMLEYREGAGGGGDFFVLDAPIPSQGVARSPVTSLCYRLYYRIGDTVYTEGILHEHVLPAPAPTPAPETAPAGTATGKRSSAGSAAKSVSAKTAKAVKNVLAAAEEKMPAKRSAGSKGTSKPTGGGSRSG